MAPLHEPPDDETIEPLPFPSGAFLEVLEILKQEAFEHSVNEYSENYLSNEMKLKPHSISYYINGFNAFKLFYAREFYRLPMRYAAKYFAIAWDICPHKHIWESYAIQYRSYIRSLPFLDWLFTCKKKECNSGSLVMVQEFSTYV